MTEARTRILEPERQTPVAAETDVLVVGGGPAGVGAALAAAREGARVLVLERRNMLGGMWTAGLLNPFFDPDKGWIVGEVVRALQNGKAWARKGMDVFDVETMKSVLERMFGKAGIEFWYDTLATQPIIEGERLSGAIVESKSGREAVLAEVVVDCTGDGDMAARAGIPFEFGREEDQLCQPLTLMFEIGGIEGLGQTSAADVKVHEIHAVLEESIERNRLPVRLPYGPNRGGTPYLIALPGCGVAVIQATHVYKVDPTNARELTRATVQARRQVHDIFMEALRGIPGLERIRLNQTAPAIGVRESRHLEGAYRLDLPDMLAGRRFEDAVTSIGFGIDIHEIAPDNPADRKLPVLPPGITLNRVPRCDIPYRCLLPKTLGGLLFAGRCISGSHWTHAAYRVTGTCMAMGQAAGLAAAIAVREKQSPAEVSGEELHAALRHRGVTFLPR